MDKYASRDGTDQKLFPAGEPFDRQMVDTGDGHQVYVERCGNPDGIPVVVLHGGPGGGCNPAMRRFFDPSVYHVILFDQRGCGRSRPHASTENNTTWHLIADMERLRGMFGIDQWAVFGGSWGATLALVYAQTHPERVLRLILRGVFLATEAELAWFYGGGAGRFFPELWRRFTGMIPEEEQDDLIAAYNRRLFSGDRAEDARHARVWTGWENALASMGNDGRAADAPAHYALAFARLENHYFHNHAFLGPDQRILDNMEQIAHIPGHIVQGRYDMVCPPAAAAALAERWPGARLEVVPMAGHALSEPGISAALERVMRDISKTSV